MVYNRCTNHFTSLILEYGECEITAKGPPSKGLKVIFNNIGMRYCQFLKFLIMINVGLVIAGFIE